jgi:(1->4)-alpha-D-glucan 1-alpha-D-glucosylmutase
LREPALYLQQLHDFAQHLNGQPPYVVVEKILVGNEELPARWCAAGTTGYEFSKLLNGLFVDEAGFAKLKEHFARLTGVSAFDPLVYECKREAMRRLLPAEFGALTRLLSSVTQLSESAAGDVIREVTACLPVYRTYFGFADSGANDAAHMDVALRGAAAHGVATEHLAEFEHLILTPSTEQQRDFTLRWQQFTGPVMAKGLEDTALYRYTPLLSVCDVGLDPRFAITSARDFHAALTRRAACWPGSLNATSTHDSKRSEDVRARINVLSEIGDVWLPMVDRWFELNARFRKTVGTLTAPQPAEELALYQTMIGAWPLEDGHNFGDRVDEFLLKALREAKERSSWGWQNDAYEEAVLDFARAVLEDNTMLEELKSLERRTSFYGALNSLSQLVLKLGAPGVPDFYQGNELWALTLVDPDNRRSVNYELRMRYAAEPLTWSNAEDWRDGRIKLHVTRIGLALRNEWPDVFDGEYLPLEATGERARHVIAFERRAGDRRAVFIAARYFTQLCEPEHWPRGDVWESTLMSLGEGTWLERLANRRIETSAETPLSSVLQNLPFAILTSE